MSDYIELDNVDLIFMKDAENKRIPLTIEAKYKELKPLEEIIKDEE